MCLSRRALRSAAIFSVLVPALAGPVTATDEDPSTSRTRWTTARTSGSREPGSLFALGDHGSRGDSPLLRFRGDRDSEPSELSFGGLRLRRTWETLGPDDATESGALGRSVLTVGEKRAFGGDLLGDIVILPTVTGPPYVDSSTDARLDSETMLEMSVRFERSLRSVSVGVEVTRSLSFRDDDDWSLVASTAWKPFESVELSMEIERVATRSFRQGELGLAAAVEWEIFTGMSTLLTASHALHSPGDEPLAGELLFGLSFTF